MTFLIMGLLTFFHQPAFAQSTPSEVTVEWYQAEMERGKNPGRVMVVISGKTQPQTLVEVNMKSITVIRGTAGTDPKKVQARFIKEIEEGGEVVRTLSNGDGYFELATDFPQGLVQTPIVVSARNQSPKSFLITFDVNSSKIKMNTQISKSKPPAAAKSLRAWAGMGITYQKYSQTVGGISNVAFANMDFPSLLVRLGYWGKEWGIDLFYRDAPGKIDSAAQPFTVASTHYHWTTYEVRGSYQFSRGSGSRLFGLPSQWQLLFGTQIHKIPFLDIDNTNTVNIQSCNLTMATVGAGLLLGQEKKWSYEFALEYQYPLSASGNNGNTFSVSSPIALDARVGTNYKLSSNWRAGLYGYLQTHSYSFNFANKTSGSTTTGSQSLFYSTFDLHVGYEY